MPLNPRQQRFVAEYLIDLNATQAAIRAGYAPASAHVHASRMLKDAKISEAVEQGKSATLERAEIDQDWVVGEFKATLARARALDDLAAANKAVENIGKIGGLYVDRKETGKPGDFDKMTLDQKRDRVRQLAKALGVKDADAIGPVAGRA